MDKSLVLIAIALCLVFWADKHPLRQYLARTTSQASEEIKSPIISGLAIRGYTKSEPEHKPEPNIIIVSPAISLYSSVSL